MGWTRHPFAKLLLVTHGKGTLLVRGRQWPLYPGLLTLVPPGLEHRLADGAGTPLALLILGIADQVIGMDLRSCWRARPSFIVSPQGVGQAADHLRRLLVLGGQAGVAAQLRRRAICGLLLADLLGDSAFAEAALSPRPRTLSTAARVTTYLGELEGAFFLQETLAQIAARLGISRRALTLQVRAQTGRSWLEHRNALRLAHARHLLRTTGRSITAIAFECGFTDLSAFYRAFRRAEGVAPGQWRERMTGHHSRTVTA